MKRFIFIAVLYLLVFNTFAQSLPVKTEIIDRLKLVNDYWIQDHPDPGYNDWARAAYFTGNMAFYSTYPKKKYKDYALLWAENNYWGLNYGPTTRNADNQCAGQTYIDLYWSDNKSDSFRIASIDTSISKMIKSTGIDDWWWIDALYMAMPVFTRLGNEHNDTAYFNRMYAMYRDTKIRRNLYNQTTGLWYRDESFAPPYSTPNGLDSYWSRGNGWVFAAHASVIGGLPDTNIHRQEYIETFQHMAEALKARQRSDGFWNVSLDDPNDYGGPETSGTSFFTYGMAWGVNHGLLDSATYYPVVVAAWQGLCEIAIHENGYLGYIQGVGSNPSSSQPVTYETTSDFGVGAFLLAGSEVAKLAPGEMPVAPVFFMDSVKVIDESTIRVYFNDTVDETSASTLLNYSIPGLLIKNARRNANLFSVDLTVSEMGPGQYQLTVKNIASTSGHQIEDGENILFTFTYGSNIEVTASSYEAGSVNYPENTLDLDMNTRWSAEGLGEWITYNLGKIRTVASVDLAFYHGDQRKAYFSISWSADGMTFHNAFYGESSSTTSDFENFDFTDQRAQYIKITGYGNSSSLWNSITETRINIIPENTFLASILVDAGTLAPGFNPEVTTYTLVVPGETSELLIEAKPDDSTSFVTGDGQIALSSDTTEVHLVVTAFDSVTTRTYAITIIREQQSIISPVSEIKNLNVFPNPSRNNFTIQIKGNFRYSIYTMSGNIIEEGISAEQIIWGQEFETGVYLLKVSDSNIQTTYQLIKY
jgi:rhamnogalacturonyl hydrolase YesR